MSREAQTYWIVGSILAAVVLLITAYVILQNKAEYDKVYPGCWQLIGHDLACEANVATARIEAEHSY